MKRLLLITGDLATGKSTFAHMLSRRYRIPVFCKDTIKEVLGDCIGFADRQENLRLSRASVQMMAYLFSALSRQEEGLILEANFRQPELEQLQRLAQEQDCRVLTLSLQGEVEILHRRYLRRISQENRHPVHLSPRMDQLSDFADYVRRGRELTIPGEVISITADDFSYQSDAALLQSIDAFMTPITVNKTE